MKTDELVIVAAKRTAMGGLLGVFKDVSASQLGAHCIEACLEEARLEPEEIQEVIMGCVLMAGQGQAPARQAALKAKLPLSAGATTINKMCGSGMKAIMQACDAILANTSDVVVAGGIENMSQAPYLMSKVRAGLRIGHSEIKDHMFLDGLEDAYQPGRLMGTYAEETAKKYKFSREQQDEFALTSLKRAQTAIQDGSFKKEIVGVKVQSKTGETLIVQDEQPLNAKPEKIPQLKPAFAKDGTVTAANSSSISDGAACVIVMKRSMAEKLNITPLATIKAYSTQSQEPAWFTTAPVGAIQKVCAKAKWELNEVDLFEINEAFAVVTMAAMHDLKLSYDKVNVHGGACALGHPIGASGARIVVSLIHALQKYHKKRGVAALCIGGGEATALALELCD